ncbi:uncharacterized protein LOC110688597 [Chenopodium quinoa]|uniref:uncharacterized protein LOC110688597 n=1 Tax=Chenopodium quinoa TaxID=63459 RepID=UPI000B788287|nr:uncharacterized protein LOC110688597 [Chenopodium quinoa]
MTEGIEEVIRKAWADSCNLDMPGKLQSVAHGLTLWSKDAFEDLGEKIAEIEEVLKEAKRNVGCQANFEESDRLEGILNDLHDKNEAYWFLCSRVFEIKDGDRNTKYFHHMAAQRRSKNYIKGLMNTDGVRLTGNKDIEKIILDFYGSLFAKGATDDTLTEEVLNCVPTLVTEGMNLSLCRAYSEAEIFAALSQMSPYNALIALELFHTMKKRSKGRRGSIAMKLDMSKAYDKVEWDFLRRLLTKLGFAGAWVDTIMAFVTTVRYSFIINGIPSDPLTPSRGLCQGDPISPYIFILVADVLSRMLQVASEKKLIHGARASRNGSEITHLFFADDSLLFTRATRQECSIIVDILNKYEATSGQKINLEKSEVSFSRGVQLPSQITFSSILGMEMVDNHIKYLGLPTIIGRSKKTVFASVKDRILKKIQGWKEKLLSRAGKEILLKSVIQAIPTYLMGMYKFPSSLIREIHAMMARFWWGSNEKGKKIHWKSWDSLCQPKCLGGMGFRDLGIFNEALLGKQLWRLATNEHSLFSRILKAKYYPRTSIFEAALGPISSYSWQSLWGSKALVNEGMLWRVGNGRRINIWNNPWLIDDMSRFATSDNQTNMASTVNELMELDGCGWDVSKVESMFNDRDKQAILAIPISERSPEDTLTWAWSKDGLYSVKTAYILGKSLALDDFERYWVEIWKAKATPKVLHFLWKCCSNSLPIRSLLTHRHITNDPLCPCCETEPKTASHAVVLCPSTRSLRMRSG